MIGLGLLRILARRNRFLVSQVEDLSFRTVQARAANYCSISATAVRSPLTGATPDDRELATRIATVPEAFSHRAQRFQDATAASPARAVPIAVHYIEDLAELAEQSGSNAAAPEPRNIFSPDMTKVNDPWLQM